MDQLSEANLLWLGPPTAVASDLSRAVRDAVASVLTARQREVVEAHFFEGVSQGELALRLGVSQQVIHKCLYGTRRNGRQVGGALKKLRAALAHWAPQRAGDRP